MSADKRKITTDALETLGTIIEDGGRDAIHLAVEPCVAGENLYPGQHIGIVGGLATTSAPEKLGIVDPFVKGFVPEGKKFWLVVYPRQITSLRHVWTHPKFDETVAVVSSDPVEQSKAWIAAFADRIRQHPIALMEAADMWVATDDGQYGGEYTYDNSENYKEYWDEFPEFWRHYEIVTGKAPKTKSSFFTCSC